MKNLIQQTNTQNWVTGMTKKIIFKIHIVNLLLYDLQVGFSLTKREYRHKHQCHLQFGLQKFIGLDIAV